MTDLKTTITKHDRAEFMRFALDCIDVTGFLPRAFFIATCECATYPADRFDAAAGEYRQWLTFGRYPADPDDCGPSNEDAAMLGFYAS